MAQLSIVSTHCAKGEDVVLHIRNKPPEVLVLVWYRGNGVNKNNVIAFSVMTLSFHLTGPENNGQEIITYDGSLLLKKVTMKDAGTYTVVAHLPDSKKEIAFGQLDVYGHVRAPTLLASNTTVTENKDAVVMSCYTNANSTQWLVNGTQLQFTERMKLSKENQILTIDPVKREDAGNYQCEVSNPVGSAASVPLELNVKFE
ncbi:carcinoembryonic antigen-related cell adhesion molecule 21-like [Phyllostomus discolor]|uniref:Carcinoembryonic antigen-related cell adhesion molecule 21-like n=1 Tax=Phyllostomus discolor TaxID=89673 RepID=A0A7E6CMB0_9CHIR|nr:carcinoembryonic antigen-related cell adhesion molecule 21-like [Phyllostomus discolor]